MNEALTLNYREYQQAARVKPLGVLFKSPLWRRILVRLGFKRFGRWEVHYWYEYIPPREGPPEYVVDGTYLMPDGSIKSVRQIQERACSKTWRSEGG